MHVSLTAVPYKQLESFSKQYLILCNGTCNSEFKHCILKIVNDVFSERKKNGIA